MERHPDNPALPRRRRLTLRLPRLTVGKKAKHRGRHKTLGLGADDGRGF